MLHLHSAFIAVRLQVTSLLECHVKQLFQNLHSQITAAQQQTAGPTSYSFSPGDLNLDLRAQGKQYQDLFIRENENKAWSQNNKLSTLDANMLAFYKRV